MREESSSFAATTFGHNLRKLRKARHLTQEKLAEELGISTKHVSELESGKSFTTGSLMDSIASYFSVNYYELFMTSSEAEAIEKKAAQIAYELMKKNTDSLKKRAGVSFKLKDAQDFDKE